MPIQLRATRCKEYPLIARRRAGNLLFCLTDGLSELQNARPGTHLMLYADAAGDRKRSSK